MTWQVEESSSDGQEQQAVVAGCGHWREMCFHAGGPAPSTAQFLWEVPPEPELSTTASSPYSVKVRSEKTQAKNIFMLQLPRGHVSR